MKKKAFKAAFPYTIPIGIGFLFLGMSYGFMMQSKGFSVWYPFFMSMFIFAGSMEFVTANLLLSAFSPIAAFFLALMVNARHLFYGLSMLDKYKNTGWKKFYLIFGMCDESFTVNCTVTPPDDVDRGWFMFFVNLLNQIYWVSAATAGALLGYVVHFDTTGIAFVMTALFVVMFLNQWEEAKDHRPALVGLICSAVCLLIFGSSNFIVPSMIFIKYLGTVLPYAAIGLLVIYCLKDVPASSTHGLPEAIAIVFIVLLHKWKKSTLLSIGGGTVLYMVLIQTVFR